MAVAGIELDGALEPTGGFGHVARFEQDGPEIAGRVGECRIDCERLAESRDGGVLIAEAGEYRAQTVFGPSVPRPQLQRALERELRVGQSLERQQRVA